MIQNFFTTHSLRSLEGTENTEKNSYSSVFSVLSRERSERVVKFLSFLFILFPALLSAAPSTSSISSKRAIYDGSALVLSGDVELDHTLGKMASGNARLEKEDKNGPFSSIFLRDHVLITLKKMGKISCSSADLDFISMTAKLTPEIGKLINFINLDPNLFCISSKAANMEFAKEDESIKVVKVNADDSVCVQYGGDFYLYADHATYTNESIPLLTASPNCKLTHFEDLVEAEKVEVLPQTSTVILSTPKGMLKPSAFSKAQGMQFSCNRMVWENAPQILTLQGDIFVKDEGIGSLHCEDEVELRQKQQEGKWVLSSMSAKGKTELTYQLDVDFKHLLICYGLMRLDQDRFVLTLESPQDCPIEYYHDNMKLMSDLAELDYSDEKQHYRAEKLQLNGNVQLTIEEDGLRCAIADQFTYFPKEEKMVLSAKSGKNVLFWDKTQDLSVCAREVHLQRSDKKETVKGVGNVRFAFSSAENELLKKLFPFYDPKGGKL